MIYRRTFILESCHFNGPEVYKLFDAMTKAGPNDPGLMAAAIGVMQGTHGHNFKVELEISLNDCAFDVNYVVEDEKLSDYIEHYNRTNLSLLEPEFRVGYNIYQRATTETLAEEITKGVCTLTIADLKPRLPAGVDGAVSCRTCVYETQNIGAVVKHTRRF